MVKHNLKSQQRQQEENGGSTIYSYSHRAHRQDSFFLPKVKIVSIQERSMVTNPFWEQEQYGSSLQLGITHYPKFPCDILQEKRAHAPHTKKSY
jgi:hypothetical protein